MGVCELCGKEAPLITAIVEGTQMTVCQNCGKFGKVIQKPVGHLFQKVVVSTPETAEVVVSNYAQLIRQAREKSGMTMKEFAMTLNEKESIIHKLENSQFVPPINMAKKLEKLLHIKLVEIEEEEETESTGKSSGAFTIGDIINLKK
jgi:putative transcription factor